MKHQYPDRQSKSLEFKLQIPAFQHLVKTSVAFAYDLGDGTTYLRNPLLARTARRFGIAEKLRIAIRLILESCNKVGIKRAEFIECADIE